MSIKSNQVFKISSNNYQNIKQDIIKKFEINLKKPSSQSIADVFEVITNEGKITFTFYKTNKLMIQSSTNNQDFIKIVNEISGSLSHDQKKQTNLELPSKDHKTEFDYYVGCDEAGKGETFGSLFLGCALIKKEYLESIEDNIKNKNIRNLDKKNIINLKESLNGKYNFLSKEYSANEIDKYSLNVLLDKGYKQLVSKAIENKNNILIAIDDYGIGSELKNYIKTVERDDVKFIVKYKADEEYTACKIASLGARALRMSEIDEIDERFVLIEEITGKKFYPSSGSSSNSNTEKYLKLFKKQNPTLEFPEFVRKRWNNVKSIK